MKVLIVCRETQNKISPFVLDQVASLEQLGITIKYFTLKNKGFIGYLRHLFSYRSIINKYKPDIVHAHYGLSGLFATLQKRVPVVITFHGSDINLSKVRQLSFYASRLSKFNIFVSQKLLDLMPTKNSVVIPCGVNLNLFYTQNKKKLRNKWNMNDETKYILFSSHFNNSVKNYPLAKSAIEALKVNNVELLELKGYDRYEVAELINAVDVCLLTSFSEGSPQFIKEAMACNCPIVSTDVGDVRYLFGKTQGNFITTYNIEDCASQIIKALKYEETDGYARIKEMKLDSESVALNITNVYRSVLKL